MLPGMALLEHTFTHFLRNSGAVLEDVEKWDVILRRRDGADLYITLDSRETSVRDMLGLMARLLVVAATEPKAMKRFVAELPALLPWATFLPPHEKEQFLSELFAHAAGCVEINNFEPLQHLIWSWQATADVYANPEIMEMLNAPHDGPPVPIKRPKTR